LLLLLTLSIIVIISFSIKYQAQLQRFTTVKYGNPVKRKEWRTLKGIEQKQYIEAVQCLMERDSLYKTGTSRYDDFAYIHTVEGVVTHYAASFLPWHRYFLHIFELSLRQDCGYGGSLASVFFFKGIYPPANRTDVPECSYWDWTADASDFAASPIWDVKTGFGGDGDLTSEASIFNGRCVMEGPFANVTRHWQSKSNGLGFDILENPHCLSRGFSKGDEKKKLQSRISDAIVQNILDQPSYSDFFDILEARLHNAIPLFIKGDFFGMTAPNGMCFQSCYFVF